MCNLYRSVPPARLVETFRRPLVGQHYAETIAPLKPGPFVLADRIQVGQWGLIPHGSKTRTPMRSDGKTRLSTNNCRRETVASAWTYRHAWSRGQRCLIPAESFDEPYWGTGRNTWWRFHRQDGTPWALAGIWSEWTDPATGEIVHSYSMLTQNCDAHPLLRLMHKPDPQLPPHAQDKRAVVPIEPQHWDQWLTGSQADAQALIRLPALDLLRHGAADPLQQLELPIASA